MSSLASSGKAVSKEKRKLSSEDYNQSYVSKCVSGSKFNYLFPMHARKTYIIKPYFKPTQVSEYYYTKAREKMVLKELCKIEL